MSVPTDFTSVNFIISQDAFNWLKKNLSYTAKNGINFRFNNQTIKELRGNSILISYFGDVTLKVPQGKHIDVLDAVQELSNKVHPQISDVNKGLIHSLRRLSDQESFNRQQRSQSFRNLKHQVQRTLSSSLFNKKE